MLKHQTQKTRVWNFEAWESVRTKQDSNSNLQSTTGNTLAHILARRCMSMWVLSHNFMIRFDRFCNTYQEYPFDRDNLSLHYFQVMFYAFACRELIFMFLLLLIFNGGMLQPAHPWETHRIHLKLFVEIGRASCRERV